MNPFFKEMCFNEILSDSDFGQKMGMLPVKERKKCSILSHHLF